MNAQGNDASCSGGYRGWRVLAGAFLAGMMPVGAIQYSFGVFVVAASAELEVSRADANNALIAMGIGATVMLPFVGRIIDRISLQAIVATGAILLASSFVIISQTSSPWVIVCIALIPLAFAQDGAGGMTANTLAARWFRRRRGQAMGIVGAAPSAGGFLMAPLSGFLISWLGWRTALAVLGLGCGLVLLLAAVLLIRSAPASGELEQAGEVSVDAGMTAAHATEQRIWSYRELLTNRNFLLLVFGGGIVLASDRAILISLVPYLADEGISIQSATFIFSAITGSALLGKLTIGYLADRFDVRKLFYVVAALHIALLCLLIMRPGYWVMISASLVVGIGIGGVFPIKQVLAASLFGSASYGTISGLAGMMLQVLMFSALRLIGEVRDRTGSYDLAFELFAGGVVLSTFLIWMVRPNDRAPSAQPSPVTGGEIDPAR